MIRNNPCHDPTAGCFVYSQMPSEVQEALKKALQDAYERGWWDGYAKCDDEHQEASSEEAL